MKKQATKILIGALFMSLVLTVANFDFSWANTEGSASQSTNSVVENVEKEIEFLYIESSELESPGTQNIAVAWDKDMSSITKFVLVYSDGERAFELAENNRTEKSVLFSKEFTSAETGTYKINGIKYYLNNSDKEQYFEFKDIKIRADFSVVNKQNDSLTTATENNVITTSIEASSISENVEDLLSTANVDNSNNGTENKVVVIDPGHGGAYSGACRNGLVEKHLTLKIAKYLREELQEYEGVEVYMTRETDTSVGRNDDYELTDRVLYAASKNADLLVSVHINAGGGKGAEVWTPNDSTYRKELYHIGQAVSSNIQRELVALGLYDRGVQTKDCTDNGRYPDGSLQDYYGIIRESREQGFTGIIVEHAFIDNASDAAFLKQDSNLKALGIADATGIANYYGLKKITAETIDEGTYAIVPITETSKTIGVSNAKLGDGALIEISSKEKLDSSQRFEIIKVNNKEYKILAEHSGKALDVYGASGISGAIVHQYTDKESDNQLWKFIDAGDGCYYIRSRMGTYLTLADGKLYACTFDEANDNQKWAIEKTEYKPIADGTYSLMSVKDSTKALDVFGASFSNSANVGIYQYNGQSNQQFNIKYVNNGYYTIIADHSSKSLSVSGFSRNEGANLEQYKQSNNNAQLWKFIDLGNGEYYIKSKLGTVISLSNNFANNGSNVVLKKMSDEDNKRWNLKKVNLRPIDDGVYSIQSRLGNNKVIDIGGASYNDGAIVLLWDKHNASNQRYEITYVGDGYYRIISEHSGKSFDISGASSRVGSKLIQYKYSGDNNQLWRFVDAGNGYYYIKSKLGTVIDLHGLLIHNGSKIGMYSFNGGKNQQWGFVKATYRPIEEGTYIFQSGLNSSRVLGVANSGIDDGDNIQLDEKNYLDSQQFDISLVDARLGYYKIAAKHSGKVLDVANNSSKKSANLQQYSSYNNEGQLWKFIDAGNGYYYIRSKLGTFIDVAAGKTSIGTNVLMYSMNQGNNQKWKISQGELYSIMGSTTITVDELVAYYNKNRKAYPYSDVKEANTIEAFVEILVEECNEEGIKAEVVFCQAMKETGWLQFGGQVKKEQYNFAGLGATDGGASGAEFDSIREGIRAQVQHLKAYACEEPLVNDCVDPRFKLVKRGCAPYVEWLGQKENPEGLGWATDKAYGINIVEMIKEI